MLPEFTIYTLSFSTGLMLNISIVKRRETRQQNQMVNIICKIFRHPYNIEITYTKTSKDSLLYERYAVVTFVQPTFRK